VATSNSLERAQQFVTKLQVPNKAETVKDIKAYGSYEELLADKEIGKLSSYIKFKFVLILFKF
jgi:hypothetical protein